MGANNPALATDAPGTFYFEDCTIAAPHPFTITAPGTFNIDNATIAATAPATNSGTAANITANTLIVNRSDNTTITANTDNTTVDNIGANTVINTANITCTITGDDEYTLTTGGSADTIEGIGDNTTITANNGNLTAVTNTDGIFTFGGTNITVNGDESVIVNVNFNNGIRAVNDLQGTLIFVNNTTQTINGNIVTITPVGQQITITADDNGTLHTLDGLAVGSTLNFGTRGTFTVNGTSIRITDPVNQIISCTEDGITVTYPTTDLENEWISNSTSDYIDTIEGYADSDTHNGNLVYYLDGDVNAYFEETTGKKKVILGDGNIAVAFNDNGGNIADVLAETSGNKTIELGDGGDIVVIEDTDSAITVKAGTGADRISSHGDDVTVDLAAGGTTKIMASGGNVKLVNYNHLSGAGIQGIYGTDDNNFTIGDGYIAMLGSQISFGGSNDSAVFNMYSSDGEMTKIGFTYLNGGVVDLSSQNTGARLISRNGNSTLLGGSRNDTVESAGDDYINAGAGNNIIKLNHTNYVNGATIAATEGHNTVNGLYNDFDKFEVNDLNTVEFSYDGELTIKDGSARTYINTGSADGDSDYTTLLLQDRFGDSVRAAITGDNGTISADSASRAYIGTRAGVDFSALNGDLNINMLNSNGTYNGENLYFKGINKLTAGAGNTTLIGSNGNSTLSAGSGNTSMLGGTGNDVLIGNLNGNTTYFFTANGGKDTITNFSSADTITTFDAVVTSVRTLDNDVLVNFDNDLIRIEDAVDVDIHFDGIVAKIGNGTLTCDNDATYYLATGNNATVEVAASVMAADVWLSDSGKFNGNIKALDASNTNGMATLAGNDNDNVIVAGSGNSSLWGGAGGNDTLTGGDATDMFWYLRGNGNDVITRAEEGDTINLYDWTLADITSAEITNSGVNISFNDGGTLAVRGSNVNATFMIDGLRYRANQSSRNWVEA